MNRRYILIGLILAIAVVVLSACSSTPVATPTSTPTSSSVTSVPTLPPSDTPTAIATPSAIPTSTLPPSTTIPPAEEGVVQEIVILVDDSSLQHEPGESGFPFNRLDAPRETVANGMRLGLNHLISGGLPINFAAILPAPILPAYQSQITGVTVRIADAPPETTLRLELKDGAAQRWQDEVVLAGGPQIVSLPLPALGNADQLVWTVDQAVASDRVVVDSVAFTATTSITDTATAAFVWSYGQLLNNWNPSTGLVRDTSHDASGEFDAIQATGSLAAATAQASQLGIITRADAIQIVSRISYALLVDAPRYRGLLPHFVEVSPTGIIRIAPGTEWSSVDTVIAAVALLSAQSSLGVDTSGAEELLRAIDWDELIGPEGMISQGYGFDGKRVGYDDKDKRVEWFWDVFGGESWLVGLAHAGATGEVAAIRDATPPTANGSGFIDELAWLFIPPPTEPDTWGTDWTDYRLVAAAQQIRYYPEDYADSCFDQLGLFGLSAAEAPDPSLVPAGESVYQSYGVGGRSQPNDGGDMLGAPVVVPHYAGLIASLRSEEAIMMWDWLINNGFLSPLNNVESLMFPAGSGCDPSEAVWNPLKGSWNLSLQALGWGRYLAERRGQTPILWQATTTNPLLRDGYRLLAPNDPVPTPTPTPPPSATPTPLASREGEEPDESTVGQTMERSNGSGGQVHGQFGAIPGEEWPAQAGAVSYKITLPQTDQLYLRLRYSKHSPPSVPILTYLDGEPAPRASRYLVDQGDWDSFAWTEPIPLGNVGAGEHWIEFRTDGQQYGVADLDRFVLAGDMASLQGQEFTEVP